MLQSAPVALDSVYHRGVVKQATSVLIVLTGLAGSALVVFQLNGLPWPAAGAKLLASSGFLAAAWSVGALQHRFGRILFLGLTLSWLGDAFLISQSQQIFLFGLVSFLFAHVAYIIAFASRGLRWTWIIAAAGPVAIMAALVSTWLTPQVPAELLMPVLIYTSVISIMVITAFGSAGAGASLLVVIGALLFFASDLSVAALRFTSTEFPTYVWGLPLYYAGQLCIALSASVSRSIPRQDRRDHFVG